MKNAQFEQEFYKNLPYKPYCTDELGYTFINPKSLAIKKRYLQHNPPCKIVYLVFDIDREDGAMAWHDAGLPLPTWTTQNPANGHAHICYELKAPVPTTEASRQNVIEYLAKIEAGLARKLGADVGYSGLLTKNPVHISWRTTLWTSEKYELNYLADFVDLHALSKKERGIGVGRNCTLFDTVRFWAYKAIREHRGSTFDIWLGKVLEQCQNANGAFLEPLPHGEVKATAKSIATYCWKKDAYCYQEFIDRQSRKGKLGNSSNGGKARSNIYIEKRQKALELSINGMNNTQIAKELDVDRKTVARWLRNFNR